MEDIIDKSELFEYEKYCKYRGSSGEVQNITEAAHSKHIDREYLESLKLQIEEDKKEFHIFPFYAHNFNYSFKISSESLITLTYTNSSIIQAEYEEGKKIFEAENNSYSNDKHFQTGIWYLNFSQIPFAADNQSTITLNDIFLVRMYLDFDCIYASLGAELFEISQFLCLNSNLEFLFVYIPPTPTLSA